MTPAASVAVLLCTYNGEAHLEEQLSSIQAQEDCSVSLVASDDGSTDGTVSLLNRFARRGTIPTRVKQGPGDGHTANFMSLVSDAEVQASYFAYADQDDSWDAGKLARAIACLSRLPPDEPALYCSRTRSISEAGKPLGLSPLFCREPGFRNALVQNIGGGNTMVFNRAARQLLVTAGTVDVVSHDWWTYLLVSGAGGRVNYDPEPSLSYRQHGGNEIGANLSWSDRALRYFKALGGRNRAWMDRNLAALRQCSHLLTPENREVLDHFSQARNGGLLKRFQGVRDGGLYAQTLSGNIGLYVATLLKKI